MTLETVPCPGCAGPMGLDEEVCPHCRRPRDEREIESAKEALAERRNEDRRRPRVYALRAAGVSVLAVLFLARGPLLRAAKGLTGSAGSALDAYTDPDYVAGRPPRAPEPPAAAAPDGERPPEPGAPRPSAFPADAAPAAPRPAPRPAPPAQPSITFAPKIDRSAAEPASKPLTRAKPALEPNPPGATNWAFYGVVFDWATCLPVRNAQVTVRRKNATGGEVFRTDDDGHYTALVPHGLNDDNEFVVEVTAPGYRPGQAEDHNPSWLEMPEKARLEALREAREEDLAPIPAAPLRHDGIVPLDIVLAPETGKGAP